MVTKNASPDTLLGAVTYFADTETSVAFVAALRWPNGVECPRCGAGPDATYRLSTRALWKCRGCKKQFSVKVGSIFEDSKRALKGTYVSVEPFHLFRYLDEQAYRFNNRKATDASRFLQAAASVFGKRLHLQRVDRQGTSANVLVSRSRNFGAAESQSHG
jgi:hypothetical protein